MDVDDVDDIDDWEPDDIPDWYNTEWYNEEAIYEAEPEDLLPDDPLSKVYLYPELPKILDGAVKTTRKGGARGPLILNKEMADYDLAVERLVWIDGWRETIGDATPKQQHDAMTLVVLNFALDAKGNNNKISFALAELRFKSAKKGDRDPEVVAWGPFRRPESWNVSKAHRRFNIKGEGNLAAGGAGQQLTVGGSAENETTWDRIDFDGGRSKKLYNQKKMKEKEWQPNGVMWKVTHNRLYSRGITPEFRVAVLILRHSPDPYLVDFRLNVLTGRFSEAADQMSRFVGLRGGESLYWRATPRPGEKDNCYGDGVHIVQSIDTDNLGKLITDPSDSTNLSPSWLNTWDRFQVPEVKSQPDTSDIEAAPGAGAEPQPAQKLVPQLEVRRQADEAMVSHARAPPSPAERTQHRDPEVSSPPAAAAAAAAAAGRTSDTSRVPELTASLYPGLPMLNSTDHGRLVSLEARAAQAEARIAAQDQIIFKLQQALAEVQQAVSAATSQAAA